MVDGAADGVRAGAHDHDHALGFGIAEVLDEVIGPPADAGEGVHGVGDDTRYCVVVRVDRFATLEVGVRVLGRAADVGVLGRERAATVGAHELLGNQLQQLSVGEQLDAVLLVAGAEAVEEVHERHPRLHGGQL